MKIAVILSTYNAPERLWPTLVGYSVQTHRDFEVIVADDGSTADTLRLIEAFTAKYGRPVSHVWQEDVGFRKCRILNQAILSTVADYVIFSDGDCIPRADFVAKHAELARPQRFLSGGYYKLPASTSATIDDATILSGKATDPQWLLEHGLPRTHRIAKLAAQGWRARLLNFLTPTRASWNGHNSSGWRQDLLRVNGFDERMAYWAQDREFGERLVNAGIKGVQIRYSAICVHLDHERPYKTTRSRELNKQIRAETKHNRATWTAYGIIKGPQPSSVTPTVADDVVIRSYHAA